MHKIDSRIVGSAGEHHVLSQLLRRGWIASMAPVGAPNMDILVTDRGCRRLCAIQVKTRRDIGSDKGWHMKSKHETLISDDLFYVFVDVGRRPSDPTACYILPSKDVADCIRECYRVWLEAPGRGGRPHKKTDLRRLALDNSYIKPITDEGIKAIDRYRIGWLEKYRENWDILGLPRADSF